MSRLFAVFLTAIALTAARPDSAAAQGRLTVFAAASLTNALQDIDAAWQKRGEKPLRLVFGSSGALARQVRAGAPANLFASADERWMDSVQKDGLLAPGTRTDLLRNRLVLVEPAASARKVDITPKLDLAAILHGGRLAVGDTASVPAGIYAKQALTRLGLWNAVADHLAPAEDVRAALLLVERAEAPAGVVYATDAAVAPGVTVAGVFPESSHKPIVYPFAILKSGDGRQARALLAFLASPAAGAIFRKYGFATGR